MRTDHLAPALVAILLCVAAVAAGQQYAVALEERWIHHHAAGLFDQKIQGSALQRAAFRQPDLLPLYGSSELRMFGPFTSSSIFQSFPTGFTTFPVGKAGVTSLIMLQKLAAIGPELRGKKVAISLSPTFFLRTSAFGRYYAGNFSRLHAGELAFSTELSYNLKGAVARRMLAYPATLKDDPLLRFALEQLVDGSPTGRALYYAVLPLGKLQNVVLRLQDHWEMVAHTHELQQRGFSPDVPRQPIGRLDWPSVLAQAERETIQNHDNNPFGFHNQVWLDRVRDEVAELTRKGKDPRAEEKWLEGFARSNEWTDLELTLRILNELGARPLILSIPFQGPYLEFTGVSFEARDKGYYRPVRELAGSYGIPLVDFADHDGDKYFSIDAGGHLSAKGWAHYAQALDRYYHDALR